MKPRIAATDHSDDEWYIDSGMGGPQVRVQNGGLRGAWYLCEADMKQARFPDAMALAFLSRCDEDWKHGCEDFYRSAKT